MPDNEFFKSFKRRFSNVMKFGDPKRNKQDSLDGKVLDAMEALLLSGDKPITTKKISGKLGRKVLLHLKKYGGLEASIERLESIGCIYRDEEWGWLID